MRIFFSIVFIGFGVFSCTSFAQSFAKKNGPDTAEKQNNEDRVFVCTKHDSTTLRSGPGKKFGVLLRILKKGYPMAVVNQVENYLAVEDFEEKQMWVAANSVTQKCGGIIRTERPAPFQQYPGKGSTQSGIIFYRLENGLILDRTECYKHWCRTKVMGKSGWVERKFVWGANSGISKGNQVDRTEDATAQQNQESDAENEGE